jgi:hypothetical protein
METFYTPNSSQIQFKNNNFEFKFNELDPNERFNYPSSSQFNLTINLRDFVTTSTNLNTIVSSNQLDLSNGNAKEVKLNKTLKKEQSNADTDIDGIDEVEEERTKKKTKTEKKNESNSEIIIIQNKASQETSSSSKYFKEATKQLRRYIPVDRIDEGINKLSKFYPEQIEIIKGIFPSYVC